MTWDGSGTHNRIHNFSADASAGIQAQAVRFDAEFDDISTALENCQTLTGETTPTANSPMGGFKHTGVAAATSTDNYLRADQQAKQTAIYVRDTNTGVSGTMSASAAVFPTAFTDGQRITVKVSALASTSAPMVIIINGLSANIIDNSGSALVASYLFKDGTFDLIYDSSASAFRMLNTSIPAETITVKDASSVFTGTDVEAVLEEIREAFTSADSVLTSAATVLESKNTVDLSGGSIFNQDTTLANVTTPITLAVNTTYAISGVIFATQNVGDIKFRLNVTQTPSILGSIYYKAIDESGTEVENFVTTATTTNNITTMTNSEDFIIRFEAEFTTHASIVSTVAIQAAQQVSSSNSTIVRAGTWISVKKNI